ncbi:MAG: CopG family transcriptional regulator [Gammaproteobacteria bacterium]
MAVKKVTVNLPVDQAKFLQDIAAAEHLTFTDVLGGAINSEKFFVQQESTRRKVLVEGPGQRIRVVLRK